MKTQVLGRYTFYHPVPFRMGMILIGLFISIFCNAQIEPDSNLYFVETIDGNEYTGYIVERNTDYVLIRTEILGELQIPMNRIKKIEMIKSAEIKEGKYWFENPQAARYFWSPNGYGMKAGEAYYQNIWIFYNQFSVGLTNYFSVSAGILPLFLFAGSPTPIWVVPKFSIPVVKDKFNIGAGALAGYVIGAEEAGFGILFGNATVGSKDANLTLGVGYGFAGGEMADRPIINLSGMVRISPRGYLLTENYYISVEDESFGIIIVGGRSIVKRVGIDYGLVLPVIPDMEYFIAMPWLGITIPIGKKSAQPSQ